MSVLSVAGNAARLASSVVSGKMLAGMAAGVFLLMGLMLWRTTAERDKAVKTNVEIGTAVAVAAGLDPSKVGPGQIIATLQTIATDRDTARRERDAFKETAAKQTKANRGLAEETRVAKGKADTAVARVLVITRSRDVWIAEAKSRSTRTVRAAPPVEMQEMEDVLNALYQSNF